MASHNQRAAWYGHAALIFLVAADVGVLSVVQDYGEVLVLAHQRSVTCNPSGRIPGRD
jgi:hypothetical protein